MLAPIELLGPLTYYLFTRYTTSKHTPDNDVERVKSAAEDVKEDRVDYEKKAEQKKDDIVKAVQNQGVLAILAVGTVVGLIEGFTHGAFGQL
jgi:F0F1-type ATP synthase assembly protein I